MYKKILVGIDSSSCSAKAFEEVVLIAKSLQASIRVVYAADESSLVQHGMGIGSYIDIEATKEQMREDGKKMLDTAVAKAKDAGCNADSLLIESAKHRVAEMLVSAAQDWNADLIVVGTHGRRGFERMLVGSVAENLTRIATTSLLLIREQH